MKRAIAMVGVLALVSPAAADPRKVVVMQSEGRADPALRAKVDAAILKLVRATDPEATVGDISYSDAAAAVGCKPEDAACREEVVGMLAVDELVYATVTPKPGGTAIAVHRVSKGSTTRDAQMLLPAGQAPDRLDGIAPLFGGKPTTSAPPDKPAITATTTITTPTPTEPPPRETAPLPVAPTPPPAKESEPLAAVPPSVPTDHAEGRAGHQRLELIGVIGGASLVVVGVFLWGQANVIDGKIASAPTRTRADLQYIQDLETTGDADATWGNVLVVTGVVVGGVSAYFLWKDHKAQRARTASITPAVFDHGAGLVLTVGGSP
jgi:hypothetical protein